MARESLLSDELLRHLMAVGQVDVLVGLPTLDNAATVEGVVRAVHVAFGRQLARERTVLLNVDGGSKDGTPEIVRGASLVDADLLLGSYGLRTLHRISVPYHGLPGKGSAVRTILAAADLLQARAVVLLDPDVTSLTADWVVALARPVLAGSADSVTPLYARHPLDGPLVTQLVRPLVRAAYGHRLREPLGAELGLSGAFAAHCLASDVWDAELARDAIDLWLSVTAPVDGYRVAQARLGPHAAGARQPRPGLPELFRQVVGALFACLERHQAYWLAREGSEPVAGPAGEAGAPPPAAPVDPAPLLESFRAGVRDLAPVLEQILSAETLAGLRAAADAGGDSPVYPDALWAATVSEFAAGYHHAVLHRDHLTQALVPLYLGRTASFLAENGRSDPPAIEERLEALGLEFERAKPALLERWKTKA